VGLESPLDPAEATKVCNLAAKRRRKASHLQIKWTPGSVLQDGQPIHPQQRIPEETGYRMKRMDCSTTPHEEPLRKRERTSLSTK